MIDEVENMGDFCDLFIDVSKDFLHEEINLNCDSLPPYEINQRLLYASKHLKIRDSSDKGRGLWADSGIPKEKIIINEYPTILQVNPVCACVGDKDKSLYRCHNCGQACKQFYSCDGCNIATFCTRTCLYNAYKNYHRYECYGLQRHFWSMEDTDYSYIAMRMMLYGATKQFETDPTGNGYGSFENNYPFIYKFESNFEKLPLMRVNEILYTSTRTLIYLIAKTSFFYLFKDRNCQLHDLYLYIGGILVKHYCQAMTNSVLIKFPNLPAGFGLNVFSGRGKAICPTISLLNHSCSPNATIVVYSNFIAVKSLRYIKRGEEITICYAEIDALLMVAERQLIAEELFYFTCMCSFCEYESNWLVSPYRCPICVNGNAKILELEQNRHMGYCTNCAKYFPTHKIDENLKIVDICRNLYTATYSLDHLTRIADCYEVIFSPKSWHFVDIYKLLFDKHVVWAEKPLMVMRYGVLSFQIMENYLSRLYLPLLIAKVKFVLVVLNMRRFPQIKLISPKGFENMSMFVEEVVKIKKDLLFYLPEERIEFYRDTLCTVQHIFQNIVVSDDDVKN